MLLTFAVIRRWGASAQDRKYQNRETDFNKILAYFNERLFANRGVSLEAGKYGSYLQINLLKNFSKLCLPKNRREQTAESLDR
jgi:hypothetical protein